MNFSPRFLHALFSNLPPAGRRAWARCSVGSLRGEPQRRAPEQDGTGRCFCCATTADMRLDADAAERWSGRDLRSAAATACGWEAEKQARQHAAAPAEAERAHRVRLPARPIHFASQRREPEGCVAEGRVSHLRLTPVRGLGGRDGVDALAAGQSAQPRCLDCEARRQWYAPPRQIYTHATHSAGQWRRFFCRSRHRISRCAPLCLPQPCISTPSRR